MISLVGMLASVVPLYLIAGALQLVVQESIQSNGGHYFGFRLVGIAATYLLATAASAIIGVDLGWRALTLAVVVFVWMLAECAAIGAARMPLLAGAPPGDVPADIMILALIAAIGLIVGGASFAVVHRHARRAGTLSQY